VRQFAGQEGQHSLEQAAHVDLLLAQGYGALTRMNALMRDVMRWFTRRLPRYSLAVTAAVEHLTAVLADGLMKQPERWLEPMSTDLRLLWHWHAIEESEHKAVAFDVYMATGGGRLLLRLAMLNALPGLLLEVSMHDCYFLAKDWLLFSGREWARGLRFLWGRNGILRRLVRDHFAFYRSDFHPWQNNNTAQIESFLAAHEELLLHR